MAKNYRANGRRIDVAVVSSPVTSGTITRNNKILGIPLINGLVGETVAFAQDGVWGLTYSNIGGDATVGVGSFLYWDTSANAISIGYANDDVLIGQIVGVLDATNKVYAVNTMLRGLAPRGQSQWPA
jgi:predicted RecA/RadA family phage recombinase